MGLTADRLHCLHGAAGKPHSGYRTAFLLTSGQQSSGPALARHDGDVATSQSSPQWAAPVEPMLARPATDFPSGHGLGRYAFEPKFDGYRALLFLGEGSCVVQSRAGHNITRCFPDIADAATAQVPAGTVLDGELVVWDASNGCLDFPALQRRITSVSRAEELAAQQPASFMAFDLLAVAGEDLRGLPLAIRRTRLEQLAHSWAPPLQLTPQTTDAQLAQRWLADYAATPVGVEGIVIKQLSETYKPGKRSWQKLRIRHTTEAVVGAVAGPAEALRLVLALPGREGQLLVAGMTTALSLEQSREILELLHPAGAEHPWPPELPAARIGVWGTRDRVVVTLVDPALVVEVEADTAFEFGKWRHPTRFVRARPDLDPAAVSAPPH